MLQTLLLFSGCTTAAIFSLAWLLRLIGRLGPLGRALSDWLCHAPGLDIPVTLLTVAPLILGPVFGGPWGLLGAFLGQCFGLVLFCWSHELANLRHARGPRIVSVLNKKLGRVRNHAALWAMTPVVPIFWLIRVAELFLWPIIAAIGRFPTYRQRDWVSCSRQKFDGLVGHDLVWCLYCDWMTGLWSLGSEMLRNIESFYCPIRFHHEKKCENCRHEFPDVDNGWVAADGTMAQVAAVVDAKYNNANHSWFGHPSRSVTTLTIDGKPQNPAT